MIRFKTKAAREEHPQAKHIPQTMWNLVFKQELDERLLPLMMTDSFLNIKNYLKYSNFTPPIPLENIWLCIALNRINFNLLQLNAIGALLGLKKQNIFILLCRLGDTVLFEEFIDKLSNKELNEIMQNDDWDSFRIAAAHGNLSILKCLEKIAPGQIQNMIEARYFGLYQLAAENGHLKILEYLEKKTPEKIREMIESNNFIPFRLAAANGHLDALKSMEEKVPHLIQNMIIANDFEAFRKAAENGHLDVLKYMEDKAPHLIQNMIIANNFEAYRKAAANGHLDVLKYMEDKAPHLIQNMIIANDFEAFRKAGINGHFDTLTHLNVLVHREAPVLAIFNQQKSAQERFLQQINHTSKNNHGFFGRQHEVNLQHPSRSVFYLDQTF